MHWNLSRFLIAAALIRVRQRMHLSKKDAIIGSYKVSEVV